MKVRVEKIRRKFIFEVAEKSNYYYLLKVPTAIHERYGLGFEIENEYFCWAKAKNCSFVAPALCIE